MEKFLRRLSQNPTNDFEFLESKRPKENSIEQVPVPRANSDYIFSKVKDKKFGRVISLKGVDIYSKEEPSEDFTSKSLSKDFNSQFDNPLGISETNSYSKFINHRS